MDYITRLDPYTELRILERLELVLETETHWQNQLISLRTAAAEDDDMKEIKALGTNLKSMMEGVKRAASEAQAAFETEAQRAAVNADKVKSVAGDLKVANQELEAFLGEETSSNFPPSEDSQANVVHSFTPDTKGKYM